MENQLILSKNAKVYKSKSLNSACMVGYNLNEYRIFLRFIAKLGYTNDDGRYMQPEELEREHTITAKEVSDHFSIDITNAYQVLKRASKRLAKTIATIPEPEAFKIHEIPIFQIVTYHTGEGSLTVKLNEEIMPHLKKVERDYVLYGLKEIENFGSFYTTRLYEALIEFKDTGWMTKTVDELRHIFDTINTLKLYANFKARTFQHAVDEINALYEIYLVMEQKKEGKKVIRINFSFQPTKTSWKRKEQ